MVPFVLAAAVLGLGEGLDQVVALQRVLLGRVEGAAIALEILSPRFIFAD